MPHLLHRRHFLQSAVAASTAMSSAWAKDRPAPSERTTVGVIGLGSRGFNLIDELLRRPSAQIVAVCDVDDFHYRDRPWGKGNAYGRRPAQAKIEKHYAKAAGKSKYPGLDTYSDYRPLIARKDLDAVVIATPDHWHALCAMEALAAGKDIYCEKPVTHLFAEGVALHREVARRKAIFQTGSQQRSDALFRRAVELVRNGVIGDVQRIEVGLPPGYSQPQGDTAVEQPPESLDYNFWCGPSPKLPYMRARHHRWWRGHRAYGGGVLMDWIGHHNDIAHWGIGQDRGGPTRVEAKSWVFPQTKVYNSPFHYEIHCQYADGVRSIISDRFKIGTRWVGENGWVYVTRGKLQASDPRWLQKDFSPGPLLVGRSDNHMANFLDGVRTRKPCIAPAEVAHRSITPGHLGYVSQQLGRALRWDAAEEKILDDKQADQLLNHLSYRPPWKLPA